MGIACAVLNHKCIHKTHMLYVHGHSVIESQPEMEEEEEENRFMRYDFKSEITKLTFISTMEAYSQHSHSMLRAGAIEWLFEQKKTETKLEMQRKSNQITIGMSVTGRRTVRPTNDPNSVVEQAKNVLKISKKKQRWK